MTYESLSPVTNSEAAAAYIEDLSSRLVNGIKHPKNGAPPELKSVKKPQGK